jgi:futalosine hydrolase
VRIVVITAVIAERDAILTAFEGARTARLSTYPETMAVATGAGTLVVIPGGVGAAAASLAAGIAAHRLTPDLIVSMGIAGGFPPLNIGSIAVASRIVAGDMGAEGPDGYQSLAELNLGSVEYPCPGAPRVADRLHSLQPHVGTLLTVSTITGTPNRREQLQLRHPDALAEAMEGYGVALAAERHGCPVLEIRAISNDVGDRNRDHWRFGDALDALQLSARLLFAEPLSVESLR